jgi:general stress protein 26
MNLKRHMHVLVSLALLANLVPFAFSQQPQPLGEQKLLEAARDIMETARYCSLITVDSRGRAQARTVDPFKPDKNMVVWIGTNSRSSKVSEIRRNPRVTLYYFNRDGEEYVAVYGVARLINDPKMKAKWWKEEWKEFYPDRAKDYLLIAVTPERLEVISEKKGISGDPKTWKPPSVVIKRKN